MLADRYEGKRLNSPNDLVYRSDGTLYFTDPPFGLPKFFDDPRKELPYSGVFSLRDGKLQLIATDLKGPNGIAFSPRREVSLRDQLGREEEGHHAVRVAAGWHAGERQSVLRHDVSAPGEDALDGMKVDQQGNLYVSGPGGLWIISAEGKHLGTIIAPKHPHNMAWGDDGWQDAISLRAEWAVQDSTEYPRRSTMTARRCATLLVQNPRRRDRAGPWRRSRSRSPERGPINAPRVWANQFGRRHCAQFPTTIACSFLGLFFGLTCFQFGRGGAI